MVDHPHDVALAAPPRDLVDADPLELRERIGHQRPAVGHHPHHDPAHCPPAHAHEAADRRARALPGTPRGLVLEVAGVPGAVAGPGDARHHHAVGPAAHSRGVRLHQRLHRAQVERPPAPAALAAVITGGAPAAHPAAPALPGGGTRVHHHDAVALEVGVLHHRARKTAQPSEYPESAHAVTCPSSSSSLRQLGTLGAERRAPLLYVLSDPRNPQETLKTDPPDGGARAGGAAREPAPCHAARTGGRSWSGWRAGPRSAGFTSSRACRSATSPAGPGTAATPFAARSAPTCRRATGGPRARASSSRTSRRSSACCAMSPGCRR